MMDALNGKSLKEHLQGSRGLLEEHQARNRELEGEVQEHQARNRNLQGELEEHQARIRELEGKVSELTADNTGLKQHLHAHETPGTQVCGLALLALYPVRGWTLSCHDVHRSQHKQL